MKSKILMACLGGGFLLAALGGGYVWYRGQEQTSAQNLKQPVQNAAQNLQAFEDFLNDFLKQVGASARIYKQRRQVLISLVKPENLKNSEYMQENEVLATETIATLQSQMDEIMGLFDQADKNVEILVQSFPAADRPEITERWKEQRDKQAAQFLAYFASEQDILSAYKELLSFYAQKRRAMSVDVANKKIMFTDPADQAAADAIVAKISELTKAQGALLASD